MPIPDASTITRRAREAGEDIAMALRLARDLPGYLRAPITLDEARRETARKLAERVPRFLQAVDTLIYRQPRSPYRRLLVHAGCEPGDLRALVHQEGIEGALRILADRGVYVTFDEFKGRTPAVRGSTRFTFEDRDFDNLAMPPHYLTLTSGSRGHPTRVRRTLSNLTDSVHTVALMLEAHGLRDPGHLFWLGPQPAWALFHLKLGQEIAAWHYPIHPLPLLAVLGSGYVGLLARLGGRRLPRLRHCDLLEPAPIARWLLRHATPARPVLVNTRASSAVRIATAAGKLGRSLDGVAFHCRGEPLSDARKRQIEAAGAYAFVSYGMIEYPSIGFGCPNGTGPDDVHLCTERYAFTQRPRPMFDGGPLVDALLLTSLDTTAGKIAFNTETGDTGTLEQRDCGCTSGAIGLRTHISDIRSFEKLSSEGTSFAREDVLTILEETLPARFGGSAVDYQVVEEEAEDGGARLTMRVHPDVGLLDEAAVRATFLQELARGGFVEAYQTRLIQQAEAIVIVRAAPLPTKAGKVLPFQLRRHARPPDATTPQ